MSGSSKFTIAFGLLGIGVGMLPLLAALGILPTRPAQHGDSPAWVGGAIGLAFFLAGVSVIVRSFAKPGDPNGDLPDTSPLALRVLYDLIAVAIVLLLVALFTWIAFGPGDRQFSVSGGSMTSVNVSGGSQIMGRIAFGFGAVLGWGFLCHMIFSMARRWFPRL